MHACILVWLPLRLRRLLIVTQHTPHPPPPPPTPTPPPPPPHPHPTPPTPTPHPQAMDGSMNLEQALEERLRIINCTPRDIKAFIKVGGWGGVGVGVEGGGTE